MMQCRVESTGAVNLGFGVVCDGYVEGANLRVQTHIHRDHMSDFERSKGQTNILMSGGTRHLLIAEFNADLKYRTNIKTTDYGLPFVVPSGVVRLFSAQHMLGASQVEFESNDGARVGYSGDFGWPLQKVIQVDELVVDATNGNPICKRQYSQEAAESAFLDVVAREIRSSSIEIYARRGTVHRALTLLSAEFGQVPLVGSSRFVREVEGYRQAGVVIGKVFDESATLGSLNRYIRVLGLSERCCVDPVCAQITLSSYRNRTAYPVTTFGQRSYQVALSDHADFLESIEYVRSTGATRVITDGTRGYAIDFAEELRRRLGVYAEPSSI